VPSVHSRPGRQPSSSAARVLVLAILLGSQAVWSGAVAASSAVPAPRADTDPTAKTSDTGLSPTIHWEDTQKHAGDRITFTPGARATVGFTPRSSDRWKVGGVEPRALPAGRLDGRQMRPHAPSVTADPTPTPAPAPDATQTAEPSHNPEPSAASSSAPIDPAVDQPIVDPEDVIPAVGASWTDGPVAGEIGLQARVDPGALRREVFGFLPYWEVNASDLSIQYDKISTIAYFGVGAAGDGTLMKLNSDGSVTTGWGGWTSSRMTSILNEAHRTGTRVVLTV